MEKIRSPISYSGSKYNLLDWLMPMFPKESELFIDAFGGSGVVSFNYDCNNIYYTDELPYLPMIFNWIKEHDVITISVKIYQYAEQFKLNYDDVKAPTSKEAFYNLRNYVNGHREDPDYPLLLLFLSRLCFRHLISFNKKGEFNGTYGQYKLSADYLIDVIEKIKPKMEHIVFAVDDAVKDLQLLDEPVDDCKIFIYCDPPYVDTGANYNDGWTPEKDKELRDALDHVDSLGIMFGLSNYAEHNGHINRALLDWVEEKGYHIYYKDHVYRPTGSEEHKVVEVYVCNYNATT